MVIRLCRHCFVAVFLVCIATTTRVLSFRIGVSTSGGSSLERTRLGISDRARATAKGQAKSGRVSSNRGCGTSIGGARTRTTAPVLFGAASESTTTTTTTTTTSSSQKGSIIGKAVFILPHNANQVVSKFGSSSPYGSPSILEAAKQLQKKAYWFSNGLVDAELLQMPENAADSGDIVMADIRHRVLTADAVVVLNIDRSGDLSRINEFFDERKALSSSSSSSSSSGGEQKELCHFVLGCDSSNNGNNAAPGSLCGPYDPQSPSLSSKVAPWSNDASGKRLEEQMMDLFDRWTSDDFTYALMLFFNRYVAPIDWVKYSIDASWEKGPLQNAQEFYKMITECGDCVANCVADENCKECLDALTAVDTSDQVASYRTIVSYESDLLREFSFCILQKNNVFGCEAKIPTLPNVAPMETFRGQPLTTKVARQLLIGHLNDEQALDSSTQTEISWKVAAGANVAYDQFPSQNQIFYESANGRSMWYDPVFRVETIDGRNVWAKRHYRVRDGKIPGTFRFSVLDNGVTSEEFWTLVDVAEDLSYVLFHYAGAARAVGQQYLGGLLCTADGSLPSELERTENIYPKLRSAGIDPWELFIVDNSEDSAGALDAGPPPLDFYRKDVLEERKKS